ncbi:hypothetical protein EBB07_27375 [Paenibacillaceae bacterium]|nr:hypothetical protein EBB07_27375 [Paenibacillaceae bacterium]
MRPIIAFILILTVASMTVGCTSSKETTSQTSSTFESGAYTLHGIEGKMGLLAPGGFIAGKANKYMWHFWGTKKELARKPLRVEATHPVTGENIPYCSKEWEPPIRSLYGNTLHWAVK